MPDIASGASASASGRHPMVEISARVNGRQVVRSVPNHYRLIDFVREELKLTGSKEGCGALINAHRKINQLLLACLIKGDRKWGVA